MIIDNFLIDQSSGRCVSMIDTGFWTNNKCDSKFQSICMALNSYYTTPTTPSTPPPLKCAQDWSDQDGVCYKVIYF